MFFANNSTGKRIHAKHSVKGQEYICPVCGKSVFPKQGELNRWHFSHPRNGCDDLWHYDMSDWHIFMQDLFPPEYQEIVVSDGTHTHRADILKDGIVIEFQHSRISKREFDERNAFFLGLGYRVVWVFDIRNVVNDHRFNPVTRYEVKVFQGCRVYGEQWYRWRNPFRMLKDVPEISATSDRFVLWLCTEETEKTEEPEAYGLIRVNQAFGYNGCYDFSTIRAKSYPLWTDDDIHDVEDFFQVWDEEPDPVEEEPYCSGIYRLHHINVSNHCPNQFDAHEPSNTNNNPTADTNPGQITIDLPVDSRPSHPVKTVADPFAGICIKRPDAPVLPEYEENDGWYPDVVTNGQVDETGFRFLSNQFWGLQLQRKACGIPKQGKLKYQCPKTDEFFQKKGFDCHLCSHCAALGIQKYGGVHILCAYPKNVEIQMKAVEIEDG